MSDEFDLLDLIARARRQELSSAELRRLERQVEASAALRAVQQMSRDFAALAEVRPGDDKLIDRSIDLALASRGRIQRRRKLKPQSAFFLGVAALLIGASTAFGYWGAQSVYPIVQPVAIRAPAPWVDTAARPRVSSRVAIESEQALPAPAEASASVAKVSPNPELNATTPGEVSSSSAEVRLVPKPRGAEHQMSGVVGRPRFRGQVEQSSGTAPGAAALFSKANAARRAGHSGDAVQYFLELQRRYPQSSEAAVSRLSLGNLLFEQGDASGALLQFAKVQGALTEEGLVGQAQAYTKLGRNEEARVIWEQLRERFPGSVYASQAQDQARGTPAVGASE